MKNNIMESLTVKEAGGNWITMVPGTKFVSRNKANQTYIYEFRGRDFDASPHGEDYWKIKPSDEDNVMSVETEWFRQRFIQVHEQMHEVFMGIEMIESDWGTDYMVFTVPEGIDSGDIENAMEEALIELEEDTSLVDEEDSASEFIEKILKRAAEIVGGSYRFAEVTTFRFRYDWEKWYADHEEQGENE